MTNTPGQQQMMAPDITSNHSDFPSDQAAILRDLARNGAADEASMYGFTDMGSNMQSNGADPSQQYSFSDTYPTTGLSSSYQDMDDSAALLGSLAAFEHPPSNDARTSVSNDHFASLLRAAETAEGEEIARTEGSHEQDNAAQTGQSGAYDFFKRTFEPEPRPKRKRTARGRNCEVDAEQEDGRSFGLVSNKRRNKSPPEDPGLLAREREIWGPETPEGEEDNNVSAPEDSFQPQVSTAAARALGVHSAAALFRRPSKASKKYTRPPMSRLFTSLEVATDRFIEMQNAAKKYMLDENYPHRRECVGTKETGEPDLVKLKLFAEVESFLDNEHWGEKCFGVGSPGYLERKYKWPQDRNKLVTAVTPLLRRMVTNERQRQYALETRQEKRKAGEKTHSKRKRDQTSATPSEGTSLRKRGQRAISPSADDVDPKLDEYHYNVEETYTEGAAGISESQTGHVNEFALGEPDETGLRYHVNIIQDGQRVKPQLLLNPSSCPGFASLVQYIHTILDDVGQKPSSVKVLTPEGMIEVDSEESWEVAVNSVKDNDWMDGEVRCVVALVDEL